VAAVQFSPDGTQVLTASIDGTARIWERESGAPTVEPLRHSGPVVWARFSPDSLRVVAASMDHAARIWDACTGECLTEPLRHRAQVRWAEFSPDGKRVVTASTDRTTRLWDAQTGQALSEPLAHAAEVWSALFSPDGRWVVTALADGTARIWEVLQASPPAPGWLAELAEAVAGQRLNARRVSEPVSASDFGRLKRELSARPGADPYDRWGHWFLADPRSRKLSPSARIMAAESISQERPEAQ
jgi:WD40 repeat protein